MQLHHPEIIRASEIVHGPEHVGLGWTRALGDPELLFAVRFDGYIVGERRGLHPWLRFDPLDHAIEELMNLRSFGEIVWSERHVEDHHAARIKSGIDVAQTDQASQRETGAN